MTLLFHYLPFSPLPRHPALIYWKVETSADLSREIMKPGAGLTGLEVRSCFVLINTGRFQAQRYLYSEPSAALTQLRIVETQCLHLLDHLLCPDVPC